MRPARHSAWIQCANSERFGSLRHGALRGRRGSSLRLRLGEERIRALCQPIIHRGVSFLIMNRFAKVFLAVAVADEEVVGTLQLSFIPNISHRGAWRAQIEAVRVHERMRGSGLGRQFFEWSFEQARQRHCQLIQLTCDRTRPDAHRFYEYLGFLPTHTGFKMKL